MSEQELPPPVDPGTEATKPRPLPGSPWFVVMGLVLGLLPGALAGGAGGFVVVRTFASHKSWVPTALAVLGVVGLVGLCIGAISKSRGLLQGFLCGVLTGAALGFMLCATCAGFMNSFSGSR